MARSNKALVVSKFRTLLSVITEDLPVKSKELDFFVKVESRILSAKTKKEVIKIFNEFIDCDNLIVQEFLNSKIDIPGLSI